MYSAHCLLYKSVSMYCLYVNCFCTVWSTLSRISLTKAHVWWCDNKSDLIWFESVLLSLGRYVSHRFLLVLNQIQISSQVTKTSLRLILVLFCVQGGSALDTHLDAKPTIRYTEDTYEAASDAMRYDSPLSRCSAIRFNTMRFDAIRCNGKNMIAYISLVQTDSKSSINLCLLTSNASRPVS